MAAHVIALQDITMVLSFFQTFNRRNFICHGGYLEICRIAYPLVIMSASHSIMQFVDRKFLAMNSTLDVAASLPSGILYFTLFCFFMATCNYTSALVAQYYGANDHALLLRAVWSGLALAAVSGLIILLLVPTLGRYLITHSGHSPELAAKELAYFNGLLPSGIFICLSAPLFAFFSGQGRTKVVAVINIGGCLLNIVLDYMFIFGKWGAPEWGIFGAAIATSICCMASFATILIFFLLQNQQKYRTRAFPRPQWTLFKKLVGYGAPAGFQTFIDVGAFAFITFMIGNIGEAALAASVIALSINNILFVPLLGLADSIAIVTGQYIGRNQKNIAEKAVYRAWRLAAIYMSLGIVCYLGFPEVLANFFYPQKASNIDFAEVTRICAGVLAAACVFNACDSIKFIFMGAMRGAGDTVAVFVINLCTAWLVMVPGVIFFTKVMPIGVVPLWGFIAAVACLDAGFFLWRFQSGKWRKINLIDQNKLQVPLEELTVQNP